jgi:hypothetical protein
MGNTLFSHSTTQIFETLKNSGVERGGGFKKYII